MLRYKNTQSNYNKSIESGLGCYWSSSQNKLDYLENNFFSAILMLWRSGEKIDLW